MQEDNYFYLATADLWVWFWKCPQLCLSLCYTVAGVPVHMEGLHFHMHSGIRFHEDYDPANSLFLCISPHDQILCCIISFGFQTFLNFTQLQKHTHTPNPLACPVPSSYGSIFSLFTAKFSERYIHTLPLFSHLNWLQAGLPPPVYRNSLD